VVTVNTSDNSTYKPLNGFGFVSLKSKRLQIIALDALLLPAALWMAFTLQFTALWPDELSAIWGSILIAPLAAFPVFVRFGLYRAVLLYIGIRSFYAIFNAVSLHVLSLFLVALILGAQHLPFSLFIIYWFVSLAFVGGSRFVIRGMLQWLVRNHSSPDRVIIFGAGEAGIELAEAIFPSHKYFPVAFLDDKHELHGTEILGLKVYPTKMVKKIIHRYGVKQVLLAIPSAARSRRQEIVAELEKVNVRVSTVPDLMDIVSGRAKINDLREIGIEDILGREPIPPDQQLLKDNITGKSVLVTGAGGSIGSELCRQIVRLNPLRLILFELNEFALYRIDRELRDYDKSVNQTTPATEILPILGSVTDEAKLKIVLDTFSVQTLYHAAAYKHVPMVECNPIEGVKNNVFGTWHTVKAAIETNVATFIFISTDKAVRPTNVMGATKRVAELVVQAYARKFHTTRISMVRFGNVLDSSGSVVPLFRDQIRRGGPVTITHPEMTRYFMTIPEAAQLVIQAGSMARSGDVFVLDMGEPVRIMELARRMILLSGLTIRDEHNPNGDIKIQTTNVRPGEKLYEELLIGENVVPTQHPRILRAHEVELSWEQLVSLLKNLEYACSRFHNEDVATFLRTAVDGYIPKGGIEDLVWLQSHKQPATGYKHAVI
jgi:FlaA1/EpsC-like NDP-sugar epimerase